MTTYESPQQWAIAMYKQALAMAITAAAAESVPRGQSLADICFRTAPETTGDELNRWYRRYVCPGLSRRLSPYYATPKSNHQYIVVERAVRKSMAAAGSRLRAQLPATLQVLRNKRRPVLQLELPQPHEYAELLELERIPLFGLAEE